MLEIRHAAIRNGISTQNAYNQLYQAQDLLMRDSFYLWLLELLQPETGKVLLDISCGQGKLTRFAANRKLHAIGLDFAITALSKNANSRTAAQWIVGDGEQIPISDCSVDYVTHIGSLEHYTNPLRGVQEISRILKPQGKACILLPNSFGLFGNIKHVWKTGEIFDDGQPLQRYGTYTTWRSLLELGGLVVLKSIPFSEVNRPRTLKDLFWILKHPQKILRAAFSQMVPFHLTNHFVFLCQPAASRRPKAKSYYPTFQFP